MYALKIGFLYLFLMALALPIIGALEEIGRYDAALAFLGYTVLLLIIK